MKALVWHARGDVGIDDLPVPRAPEAGETLVEVTLCGLCGSDRREFVHGPSMVPQTPHPLTGHSGPVTLGHEIVGRVVTVGGDGRAAYGVEPGARIVVEPTWSCGACSACLRGDRQLCSLGGCVGLSSPGGLAAQVLVPTAGVVPVPDHVPDEWAALSEPLAVGLHALQRAGLRPGESIVVSGHGPIGAAVVALARAAGAGAITVVEPTPQRRELARALGVTAVDPGDPAEPSDEVRALRGSIDLGVDCSGASGSLAMLLRMTRPGARVVVPAVSAGLTPVAMSGVVLRERSIIGSLGYHGDVAQVMTLMAEGRVDLEHFRSTVVPLSGAVGWFEDPRSAGDFLKVLVDPTA